MQTNVHIDTKNLGSSPDHARLKAAGLTQRAIEELAVSSPSERNWRGIFIALLVIVAVLGLIVFSIVLVSPPEEGPRNRGKKPSLEDIFLKLPPIARFNGTWISDSEFVYIDSKGGLSLYNAENLTSEVLMTHTVFRQTNAVDFKISNDLKYVLLITDVIKVHEFTTLARYYIYERSTRFRRPLSPFELDDTAPHLQYVTWSPDSKSLAFVYRNDIYYQPRIARDLICRITNTGSVTGAPLTGAGTGGLVVPSSGGGDGDDAVQNGVPDWLYEVEILRAGHALWFSPDGEMLMYLSFNGSRVGEYRYPWYDSADPRVKYPRIKTLRYPKVETANPEVSVWIVNITTPKFLFPILLKPTNSVETDSYLTSAQFYADHQVSLVWLNRPQNISVILNCRSVSRPANNFNCTDFHIEKETCGWTEPIFHPVFSNSGNQALVRLPVKDGNNGDFMHACQLHSNHVIPLTHGAFEVTRILAWDEEDHIIYAMATNENNPSVRHLFKLGDTNSDLPWTCLTCQPKIDLNLTYVLDSTDYNETNLNETMFMQYSCDYNNIIFSRSYKYYIQECLGPEVPVVFLVDTITNYRLAILDSASKLRRKVKKLTTPRIKKIQVEIIEGYEAQVKLFLPPVLREYEDVTFPLVLLVDSWPGSQQVSDQWEMSWSWYLASTRNYIVAYIDVRGSGYQGERMRRQILNGLGSVDAQDQLAVLTYIRDAFKFIDRTKVCTVGRGYGGYITAMMLLQDIQHVINCSVSISPITNWQYYNSYFTEKYMGVPSTNLVEYERSDLTKRAGNLKDKNYLLIHGTADTKVKPQHSMMFAKALVEQDILFQQVVYPDEDYTFSIKSQIHMYKEISQFFNDSFGPTLDEWEDGTGFFIQ